MNRATEPGVAANLRKMAAYRRFTDTSTRIANSAGFLLMKPCPLDPYSFLRLHELTYERRNFICLGIKSKVSCIENVNFSVRYIPAIGFRFRQFEREVIFAPNHQEPRLPFAHPCLPPGVGVDVRTVVVKEVALNIHLAGLAKKGKFIGPEIRGIELDFGIASYMARQRSRE